MFLLHSDIFFWDFLILLLLVFSLCGAICCAIWIKRHPQYTIQKLCVGFLGFIASLSFLLVVYGSFIEPHIIVVTEKSIHHPLSPPLKVAVISDIHVGPYKGKEFVRRIVERTNALIPDIVLLPGDFIFLHNTDLSELEPLKGLRTGIGVFAVLGNHDVGKYETLMGMRYSGVDSSESITKKLEELGVSVLRNTSEIFTTTTGQIALAGIDDLWTGNADLPSAFNNIEPNAFTILLSHNPSVIDDPRSANAHLIISGHTHGGQIRLPTIGPISDLPTSLGREYDQGLFEIDEDTDLVITRGVGESSARARLFAWPEILLLRIE